MSRTTGIFDRLAEAQKESKKYETLREEFETFKNETYKSLSNLNELNNKLNMMSDILNSRAKQEDLQAVNLKFHNQFEELKKNLNINDEIKKNIEELKKKFLDIDEYDKDMNNIQMCLEKYILCNDNKQNSDEKRLNEIEAKLKLFEQQNINKDAKQVQQNNIQKFPVSGIIRTARST